METEAKGKKFLSGTALKLIAIITMLLDHIGAAIIERQLGLTIVGEQLETMLLVDKILRSIGRISFPIFCFLIVEGFYNTRSVKKYAIRLFIFALISEIPFNLAFIGQTSFPQHQNVFFTLLIGLITIWALNTTTKLLKNKSQPLVILMNLSIIFVGMLIAYILKTDYSYIGVFLIIILYMLRNDRRKQCIVGAISFLWEPTSVVAFILMYFYNGQRGKRINKYIFYAFYPAHLLILYEISTLIMNSIH